MPSAVRLREDYSAEELRALARRSKSVNQSRRLLSLAAVRDGMDRGAAAKIGGMDRQTLRDWVHRFNASSPEGLVDTGRQPRSLGCRRSNWRYLRRSRRAPDREKGACAGGGSTSGASSLRGWASASTSAEEAWLLAYQRVAASSTSRRTDHRGVQKKL